MPPPPPSAAEESPKTLELKKAKKLKRQKLNTQDRSDDIPLCPSLESVEYYNSFDVGGAIADVSEWSLGDYEDDDASSAMNKANIKKTKEEIASQLLKRQREKDLEELYGIIDPTSSSDEEEDGEEERKKNNERANDIKKLNDPFPSHHWESYRKYAESSEDEYDPEKIAAERERAERRRQQAQELFDNVLFAALSLAKQSAFLFGKTINFSAKYPTPAGVALIVLGLYFTIMYLEFSAAAFAEWIIQWFWPTTRLFLRCSERFLRKMAAFLNEMDDLGQSTYCDMANLWCERYSMLCEYRCSFIDMAWERTRY